MKIISTLAVMLLAVAFSVQGATLEEAKKVYQSGDYEAALPMLEEQYKKNKRNASVNQWIGVCLYNLGRRSEAVPYFEFAKSRRVTEAYRYLAQIAYLDYDFENSSKLYSQYNAEMKKGKKSVPAEVGQMQDALSRARTMLDHVERVAIIDSIVVDKAEFFKHYRLSPGVGTLTAAADAPVSLPDAEAVVYMPESQSRMLWGMMTFAEGDTVGHSVIYEAQKLYGGKWDSPRQLDEAVNIDGDSSFPFMMTDGTTLYYANNGEGSIGGYDIFISRKDTETGKFYTPQNVGMPFNSPFDDYLLVIDEFTGVGWWATDRNQIADKLTIYVYVPNDVRVNYSPEDENLASYARIDNIRATWGDNDYSSKLGEIASITPSKRKERRDFTFHLKNGVTYTLYSQFKNAQARGWMEQLVETQQSMATDRERLARLREQYGRVSGGQRTALAAEILSLEKAVDAYPEQIEMMERQIRKLELK